MILFGIGLIFIYPYFCEVFSFKYTGTYYEIENEIFLLCSFILTGFPLSAETGN